MGKNDNDKALTGDIRLGKVRKLQKRIDENSQLIESVVDKLVAQYCQGLDEYMNHIRNILNDREHPPTDEELDDFTLNLPVLLYFTGSAQETLGIKEDVAKAVKQEVYNEVYMTTSGTIADKSAASELATQNEFITHTAYNRAYKKIKLRMDAASETLQSVKKVLSRRITEYDMTRIDRGRFEPGGGK